jgi:cobalamin synthase
MQYEAQAMSEDRESSFPPDTEPTPLPRPADFLAALGTLTVLPLSRPNPGSEAFGRAAIFFPVVGMLIGALLVGVQWVVIGRLPSWWAALAVVGVWEATTGAALLRAQQSPGAARVTALGAIMAAKTACTVAAVTRPAAFLFAPLLARWALVVLATGVRDAAAPGRKFNPAITFREFALASVFSFAAVFAVAEAFGILIVVAVAALTLAVRMLVHRWAGGVSWRFLLGCVEAFELFILAVCAVL